MTFAEALKAAADVDPEHIDAHAIIRSFGMAPKTVRAGIAFQHARDELLATGGLVLKSKRKGIYAVSSGKSVKAAVERGGRKAGRAMERAVNRARTAFQLEADPEIKAALGRRLERQETNAAALHVLMARPIKIKK